MEGLSLDEIFQRGEKLRRGKNKNLEEAVKYYRYGSDQGSIDCRYSYAKMLYQGDGVPMDKKTAVELIKTCADTNHKDAVYAYARLLYKGVDITRNREEAIKYFERAIELKSSHLSEAYYNLALLYYYDRGDQEKAIICTDEAIKHGNIDAIAFYGELVEQYIIENSEKKYYEYFQEAMDKGSYVGMRDYALYIGHTAENPDQFDEYARLIKKAADHGDLPAIIEYIDWTKDENEKIKYTEMAANLGDENSIIEYAKLIHSGEVECNENEAKMHYQKAADLEHVGSFYFLAELLEKGSEEEKRQAASYYKLAADSNSKKGCLKYGEMLLSGNGVKANEKRACQYFITGALAKSQPCISKVMELGIQTTDPEIRGEINECIDTLLFFDPDNVDLNSTYVRTLGDITKLSSDIKVKAFESILMCADHSHPQACMITALMFLNGLGTDANLEKALQYAEKGAELNDGEACFIAGNLLYSTNLEKAHNYYKKAIELNCQEAQEFYNRSLQELELLKKKQSQPSEPVPSSKNSQPSEPAPLKVYKQRDDKIYRAKGKYLLHVKIVDAHFVIYPEKNLNPYVRIEQDPFCCRSTCFENTHDPVWNEDFYFYADDDTDLKILFYDDDKEHETVGGVQLSRGFHMKPAELKIGEKVAFNKMVYDPWDNKIGRLQFEYDISEGNLTSKNDSKSSALQSSSTKTETQKRRPAIQMGIESIKLFQRQEVDWEWGKQFYE